MGLVLLGTAIFCIAFNDFEEVTTGCDGLSSAFMAGSESLSKAAERRNESTEGLEDGTADDVDLVVPATVELVGRRTIRERAVVAFQRWIKSQLFISLRLASTNASA